MASAADGGGDADAAPELATFTSQEAYVYAPLPPAPSYGHRAELWDVNKWLTVGAGGGGVGARAGNAGWGGVGKRGRGRKSGECRGRGGRRAGPPALRPARRRSRCAS
jgi:hypothetical protein